MLSQGGSDALLGQARLTLPAPLGLLEPLDCRQKPRGVWLAIDHGEISFRFLGRGTSDASASTGFAQPKDPDCTHKVGPACLFPLFRPQGLGLPFFVYTNLISHMQWSKCNCVDLAKKDDGPRQERRIAKAR